MRKMKNTIRLIFAAALAALIGGCSDGNSFSDDYAVNAKGHYLKLSKSSFNAPAKGEGRINSVDVTSITTSWAFTGMDSWLSVSPASGNDSQKVTLSADENESGEIARTSVFKFSSTESVYTYEQPVTVTQDCTEPVLTVPENDLIFSASQSSKTMSVTSNIAYSVIKPASGADWLTTSVSEDGKSLTVSVSENRTGDVRTSSIQLKGKVTCLLTVSQQTASVVSNSTDTIKCPFAGNAYELNITSDVAWHSQSSASWIAMTPDKGSAGTTKVRLEVAANLSVSERSGFIQVLTDDYKALVIPVHQEASFFTVSGSEASLTSRGGSHKVSIATNDDWTATVGQPSWMHISQSSGKGNIEVTLTADDNPSPESRTDTTVFQSANTSSIYSIVTTQAGRYLNVNTAKLMFLYVGKELQLVVGTDGTYEARVTEGDWLRVSTDGDVVTVVAERNETNTIRVGKIVLNMTDLKSGSLSREVEVVQMPKSNITAQTFDKDQQWELNSDGSVKITVTGFGTDQQWDSVTLVTDFTFSVGGVSFIMKFVEAGTFDMGSTSGDNDEKPVHGVTFTKDYYIGETEVTQALWKAVMGYSSTFSDSFWNSSYGLSDNYPAYCTSYEDAQTFITKLNSLTGQIFRIPTEAEWEYAAKGGNKSKGYIYSGSNTIQDVAWYDGNSGSKAHEVKTKAANELGLYDMSGNVWEWCSDWYGSYSSSSGTDPTGAASGSYRVIRGGGWDDIAPNCRVTYRSNASPSYRHYILGIRLALSSSK